MKIRLIRQWKRGTKVGDVREIGDGVANLLIRRKFAVPHEDTPPEDVRYEPARAAMNQERVNNEDAAIPEAPRGRQAGRREGGIRPARKQAAVAEDSG